MPENLACSYIEPSTSLETALVHSEIKVSLVCHGIRNRLTIQNGKLGLVIEYSCHTHLGSPNVTTRHTWKEEERVPVVFHLH